jgi:hypothetical protein
MDEHQDHVCESTLFAFRLSKLISYKEASQVDHGIIVLADLDLHWSPTGY